MDSFPLDPDQPACYRICTQGAFDAYALDLLSGVWVISEQSGVRPDATTLVGQVTDQAALMGVLGQIYSLGLLILSVEHLGMTMDYAGPS